MRHLLRRYWQFFHQGIGWIFGTQVIVAIGGFFLTVVLANNVSAAEFGLYKFAMSFFAILALFSLPGINTVITKSVSLGAFATTNYLINKRIYWSIPAGIASLVIASYYYMQGNIDLTLIFCVAALGIPLQEIVKTYQPVLNGKKNYSSLSIWSTSIALLQYASLAVGVWLGTNILTLITIYFLTTIILGAIPFIQQRKLLGNDTQKDKTAHLFGINLSVANFFSLGATHIDKIIIFTELGASTAAFYAIAITPVEIIRGLLKSVTTFLFPRVSSYQKITFGEHFRNHLLPGLVTSVVLCVSYVTIAPPFFQIFFEDYISAITFSQIYALSLLGIAMFSSSVLEAKLATKEIYQYKIIAGVTRIVFIVIGLSMAGLIGVIIAQICARIFNLALAALLAYKILK